ncbi:hypothetical protein HY346_02690 [Candidatus Microgenomates bacterium]|nr:hypothetical protein [Candidatus Microgenomates bacterium]
MNFTEEFNMNSTGNFPTMRHLKYELRMLLGAAKLQKYFSENFPGNTENYPKDSVYLHARNLYNFFTKSKSRDDGSITQYGDKVISSPLYPKPWGPALNNRVMHIGNRSNTINIQGVVHLNDMVQEFAQDITRMWQEWIDQTSDLELRQKLEDALAQSEKQSSHDVTQMRQYLQKDI